MSLLRDIKSQIKGRKAEVFNLKYWWRDTIEFIKNVCFLGEIEKDFFYMSILHQIIDCETHQIINLNFEEANDFCLRGRFKDLPLDTYKPFAWTFWQVNLKNGNIIVYTSFNGDNLKSPKDNYLEAQKGVQIYNGQQLMHVSNLKNLRLSDKIVFKDLLFALHYSKMHQITTGDFHRKIFTNFQEYWGIINNKNFMADEYKNNVQPEMVRIPQKHEIIQIRNEIAMLNMMRGMTYSTLDFDINAVQKTFKTYKELHDYLYSFIDYINKNNLEYDISQRIEYLEKHFESNKWPIPADEEERAENKKKYTLYRFAATKFEDKIAIRADVREFGVCYYLTNYNHGLNPWS